MLQSTCCTKDGNSTDDTSPTFKLMEDGSEIATREGIGQLSHAPKKFTSKTWKVRLQRHPV